MRQYIPCNERAYKNFFAKHAAFPRFKKKGQHESFRYPDAKQFKLDQPNARIFLPKLGWMRLRLSRPVLGKLCNATTAISQNHAMVVIEDLQVRNMSKSAKGSAEQPGKNVRAKSGLNKSILDQGWYEFRRQLEYKLGWNGGMLITVPAHNTSRTCPQCGCVSADSRKSQAVFRCVECGHEGNADHIGAINILARGHRVAACGEDVSRAKPAMAKRAASVKQEPIEATCSGNAPVMDAVGILRL